MKRFISPDPLGIDGGVNVYAMANLNPLFFVDPYGLCADQPSGLLSLIDYLENGYTSPTAVASKNIEFSLSGTYYIPSGEIHTGFAWNDDKSDFAWTIGLSGGIGGGMGIAPAITYGYDSDSPVSSGFSNILDINGAGAIFTAGIRQTGEISSKNNPGLYGGFQLPSEASAHYAGGWEISIKTSDMIRTHIATTMIDAFGPVVYGTQHQGNLGIRNTGN